MLPERSAAIVLALTPRTNAADATTNVSALRPSVAWVEILLITRPFIPSATYPVALVPLVTSSTANEAAAVI